MDNAIANISSIVATVMKGTMLCSLALDYSIHIRLLREKDKLQWGLLPLSRWEGSNLGVGTIALHALSDNGAKEEGGFMLQSTALELQMVLLLRHDCQSPARLH